MNFYKLCQILESRNPEELAFLRAIEANPNDSQLKLVYADWLEERGREDWAKFIRAIEGMRSHIDDYFRHYRFLPGEEHPYNQASKQLSDAETKLRTDLYNFPYILYPSQMKPVVDIYAQHNWSHHPDYKNLKVSHVEIFHSVDESEYYPNIASVRFYVAANSGLVGRTVEIDTGNPRGAQILNITEPQKERPKNIIQESRGLERPKYVHVSIVNSDNPRVFRTRLPLNQSDSTESPIPFSADEHKGYGRVEVEFEHKEEEISGN